MKLHIMSDIHLEFGDYEPSKTDADVVILAGDISDRENAVEWAKRHFAHCKRVFIVLGNHEFWRKEVRSAVHKYKAAAKGSNIEVLEQDSARLGEVEFFGTTLWTDLSLQGKEQFDFKCYELSQKMNDFRKIKFRAGNNYRKLRPMDTLGMHNDSLRWLSKRLQESEAARKVVISHHAPSERSLSSKYRGELTSIAYASNLDGLIETYKPDLWVHGHVHTSSDYQIGETRVVCNPRGYYPAALNPEFDRGLVIDV